MLVEGVESGFIVMRLMNVFLNCLYNICIWLSRYLWLYDWDSNMVVTANGLHKNYSTYNFMYPFIVTMHCMSVIKPLST